MLSLLTFSNALEITCNYKVHETYGYGCEVAVKGFKDTLKSNVKHVRGIHLPGKTKNDVKYLIASNAKIKDFPENLASFFPNLVTINVNFPNIKRICHEDLRPFGAKLRNLMLQRNQIEFIPGDLFESTPNIAYLYMTSPKMKNINKNAFQPLTKLRALFVKFECDDGDATNAAEVKEMVDRLAIKCYDPKFIEPSPCKNQITIDYDDDGSISQFDAASEEDEEPKLTKDESDESGEILYWIIGIVAFAITFIAVGAFVVARVFK